MADSSVSDRVLASLALAAGPLSWASSMPARPRLLLLRLRPQQQGVMPHPLPSPLPAHPSMPARQQPPPPPPLPPVTVVPPLRPLLPLRPPVVQLRPPLPLRELNSENEKAAVSLRQLFSSPHRNKVYTDNNDTHANPTGQRYHLFENKPVDQYGKHVSGAL